ncbi:tetratricopeptide repeat protein [Enterobacter sp. C4G1]|uniref:tetratricopeptide repeat protein n=1 Tax=Enterobacter sp. C4G1 TaxID=3458724 RepID=UPI0040697463
MKINAKKTLTIVLALFMLVFFFGWKQSNKENGYIQRITTQAEKGNAKSQLLLGKIYLSGEIVSPDYKKAEYWLIKSADLGNNEAINQLGILAYVMANRASHSPNDIASLNEKIESYRKPLSVMDSLQERLKGGDMNTLYFIGSMYYSGQGAKRNYTLAREYFERSSSAQVNSSLMAEIDLGDIYRDGHGVAVDKVIAAKWYQKACGNNAGTPSTPCLRLGELIFEGEGGVNKNYQMAEKLLNVPLQKLKMVDGDAIKHQKMLLTIYKNGGYGIDKDEMKAKAVIKNICFLKRENNCMN